MEEILNTLSWVIDEVESKTLTVGLKGPGGEATALLESLLEGTALVRRARAAFRQSQSLLVKEHGKLVKPEE